jgi:hypothetical protein
MGGGPYDVSSIASFFPSLPSLSYTHIQIYMYRERERERERETALGDMLVETV